MSGRLALALLAVGLTGCLETFDPDVGEPLRPLCTDEDSNPDQDVSFADDIETGLFEREDLGCRDCHSGGGATPLGIRVSGLSLSSYSSLRRGGDESGQAIVVPGKPCQSILLQKVGQAPPFGARMPLDGPPFLTAEERQIIADWIAEGAEDD